MDSHGDAEGAQDPCQGKHRQDLFQVSIEPYETICSIKSRETILKLTDKLKLIDCLFQEDFQEEDVSKQMDLKQNVHSLFDLIFDAGVENVKLNSSDTQELGFYLGKLIDLITHYLRCTPLYLRLDSRLFRMRSTVEFMLGPFGDIEVKSKPFRDLLYENGIEEIKQDLDSLIKSARDYYETRKKNIKVRDMGSNLEMMDDSELEEGDLVPESHREWWYPKIEPFISYL